MSRSKKAGKSNDWRTLLFECGKLLVRIFELLIVVVGLFLLVKGGFT